MSWTSRIAAAVRALAGPRSILGRNAAYRRLWLAQTGSWFGDYFNSVALAGATLSLTHSASAMGLVLLCRGLPGLVVGPLLGPTIDRWSRRTVLWASYLARSALALVFIAAFAWRAMALVYVASALLGTAASLFAPAQSAAIREVVPSEDIVAANAALTATSGLVAVLGAALGSLAASWLGPDLGFGVNALSYLWSGAWIFAADWPPGSRTPDDEAPYLERLGAGVRALAQSRVALAAAVASIGFALTAGPYFVGPAVLGDVVYGMRSLGIGLVYAADGAGFVASSLLLQGLVGQEPRRLYGLSCVAQAAFLSLFCLSPRLWLDMMALFLLQVASGGILTLTASFLQTRTPPSVQGRVFALQGAVCGAGAQLSIAVSGWAMACHGVARRLFQSGSCAWPRPARGSVSPRTGRWLCSQGGPDGTRPRGRRGIPKA